MIPYLVHVLGLILSTVKEKMEYFLVINRETFQSIQLPNAENTPQTKHTPRAPDKENDSIMRKKATG